jgi:proton-dependent oligopeptide transporter, POT family
MIEENSRDDVNGHNEDAMTSNETTASSPPSFIQDGVPQLNLIAAILSLGSVFWVVGGMEMIERLAFYGVKAIAALYATESKRNGGLGVSASTLGDLFMLWALVQSVIPIFIGGLADRLGYKRTIFISTIVKISAYLTMALWQNYIGFFAGAMLLATGTAIFKPGIQGTLVRSTRRDNSSVAWGVFYQLVNVGGWVGPLLAAFLRSRLDYQHVFYACAIIIGFNFLLLLTYREPSVQADSKLIINESLVKASLRELRRPEVWKYLLVFSGFWFMFNALFDVLPLHIRDWVDTRQPIDLLFGVRGVENETIRFLLGVDPTGHFIQPEGMLNLNAGLIMTTCFFFAWLSGKVKATTSMITGTLLASCAMFLSGASTLGILSAFSIFIFSVGEMLSSPKFSEYIGNLAPPNKTAMYLGFSQIPLAIGWTLEGKLGPLLYDKFASKEELSKQLLSDRGWSKTALSKVADGDAFKQLVEDMGTTPDEVTQLLLRNHDVGRIWWLMGAIGVVSAVGIYWYGRSIRFNKTS